MIEAIVRNNLKDDKKEGELTYSEEDIISEFNTFFFADVQLFCIYVGIGESLFELIHCWCGNSFTLGEELSKFMKSSTKNSWVFSGWFFNLHLSLL